MENGIGVPHGAGNLAYVRVQTSSIHRPYVALRRQRWKHHVEIVREVGKMNAARSRVAHLQYRISSNALLNIEIPLHVIAVWRIWLNIRITKCRRGQQRKGSLRKRRLRQRRVVAQLKKRSRQQAGHPEEIWEG